MSKAAKRIYAVFEDGDGIALVRAGSQAQAIAHVVGSRFEAIVADQDHCVRLAAQGLKVQETGDEAKAAVVSEAALRG